MQLAKLVESSEAISRIINAETVEITGIQYDSRRVQRGDLFCAIPGFHTDGHLYCQEAIARGARALMVEQEAVVPPNFPAIITNDARRAMAHVADRFFDSPSRKLWMIGVTGTNGKTTTTFLIRALLEENQISTGLTGTITTLIGSEALPVARTTPESPDLQQILADMVKARLSAAVMEVSSHALALKRVDEVCYDVAVFTNLTQDHLDFHAGLEDYFLSKALLFQRLGHAHAKGPQYAVINQDDPFGRRLKTLTPVPILTYGLSQDADVQGLDVSVGQDGVEFVARFPTGVRQPIRFPMTGRFNVFNALAALTVGYIRGLNPKAMAGVLARYSGVPGRFERVSRGEPFSVIVDYAHTPDGMENVLKTAREFAAGKIIVVFGAGGDRDRGKRPLMGEVAGRLADELVITSDNPRSEDPKDIIREIEVGVRVTSKTRWQVEPDREKAIRLAIGAARPGDVVMILGKGHETYQIRRESTIHFDDREVARAVLKETFGR